MSEQFFLTGEKIILKQVEIKDLKKMSKLAVKWVNDGVVTYYLFTGQTPKNSEQIFNDFKKLLDSHENVIFLVVDKKTKKPIGYAGLYEINMTARKAEFRVFILEKSFWGKGLGTEVTELLTFYGFDRLNLNRIYLGFTADNKGAGKAYEKAGFKKEGILRQDIYRNSQYYDSVRMAILRVEYYKKQYSEHKNRFSIKQ